MKRVKIWLLYIITFFYIMRSFRAVISSVSWIFECPSLRNDGLLRTLLRLSGKIELTISTSSLTLTNILSVVKLFSIR